MRIRGIEKKPAYTEEEQAKLSEILGEYEKNLPKATAHQRILLSLLSGERFKQKLAGYAKPLITKGAPAFLQDLKSDIYSNPGKTQAVEGFLLGNLKSLETQRCFEGEQEEQDPTVELWVMYFTA